MKRRLTTQADRDAHHLERHLEAYFQARVKKSLGALPVKLAPTQKGLPDRIVVLPGGRVYFVELKIPGGRVSEIQKHRHALLRMLGARVYVLTGVSGVADWIREVASENDPKSRGPRKPRAKIMKALEEEGVA